jgi:flagellar protein FliS
MTKKMYRKSALQQYSNIDIETKTSTYSPEELISLLFDKVCLLVRQSTDSLVAGEKEGFDETSTRAMQIVLALRGVLNMEEGGEVAKNLYETYTSIAASMFKAKREENVASFEKLYEALSELREAWKTVYGQQS